MSSHLPQRRTNVSVLTAAGRGAVAVVAVAGPATTRTVDACFQAVNRRPLARQPWGRIVYGRWGSSTGEDLVICRRHEESLEIHCHGGSASVAQVVGDLVARGCCETEWSEWIAGRADNPLAAAAQVALAGASTLRTAAILLDQFHGALAGGLSQIEQDLRCQAVESASERLDGILQWASLGSHLTGPWNVAIAGEPNVGKSSLINALVGYQRAIVFDEPATTRDVVSVSTVADGWPLELSDMAGLRETDDALEIAGVQLARAALQRTELVVWVVDANELGDASAREGKELAIQQAARIAPKVEPGNMLVVINKVDCLRAEIAATEEVLATAATLGHGVDMLLGSIVRRLVPQVPAAGAAVPFTSEQVAHLEAAAAECRAGNLAVALQRLAYASGK